MNGCVSAGISPASEALTQLSSLSKTIGLCAQEVDQLRSDNTRLQLLLRSKCDELNAIQEENRVLRNRCQQLENDLKRFDKNTNVINDVLMNTEDSGEEFESQNLWDTQSEQYLANLSTDEILNGFEIIRENITEDKQNQSLINDKKRLKTSNYSKTEDRVETNGIASTSSHVNNHGLNAFKVGNNWITSYSDRNRNQTIDRNEKRVDTNMSQILTKFMTSTQTDPKFDERQALSSQIMDKIKVTICLMNGLRMIFQVDSGETVLSLKNRIKDREGYLCENQNLFYGGKQMEDMKKLFEYKIKNGSVIHSINSNSR